ncbi:MAG: glycosyltransferase N-terminal domain-containing protein [bacterium]
MLVLKRESLPAADVWLHGASVGDARALAPLVGALRAARPELRLLYTAWTPEGRAMARQLFAEVPVHRVPWSVALRPSLARVRPRLVVWEYLELWPAWVAACRRAGAATLVVDGRVSRRSLRIRPLLARAAGRLDAFCARSPGDAARAARLGVRPEVLRIHGNGKHDGVAVAPPTPSADLAAAVGPVDVVVGSLHPDEEAAALAALAASGLRALIAPGTHGAPTP